MKEKELWMSKLKEKLEDYSGPIPASGWKQLEKELMPPVEQKIYPYQRWAVTAAAVVLLALVSSLSLYFLGTPAADEIRSAKTPALASSPDILPSVQQPDARGVAVEPEFRPVVKDRLAKAERIVSEPNTHLLQQVGNEDTISQQEVTNIGGTDGDAKEEVKKTDAVKVTKKNQGVDEQLKSKPHRPSGRDKLHLPTEKVPAKKGTWSLGLSYGNTGGTSAELASNVGNGYMSRVSMSSVSNDLVQIPNDQTVVFAGDIPYLLNTKQVVDIEHHQPISFGVNVRKQLAKGFSLETGLTYTLLTSDTKLSESENKMEQKLHYLGIPLRANWNFLDKKLFTLYVSGGGMIEKCIYGKLGSEKETVKPLQFSVSGAVGAQFNATQHIGIYVEPGVAYFFNDGSQVQTIRKENPFNFNIQAGIRLTY